MLATLHDGGFTITAKGFESALFRMTKQREAGTLQGARAAQTFTLAPQNTASAKTDETGRAHEAAEPDEYSEPEAADLPGLTPKEKRERRAARFIQPDRAKPLLKILKDRKP